MRCALTHRLSSDSSDVIRGPMPSGTRPQRCLYNNGMIDEATFRREADRALDILKKSLIDAEEEGGFEAEENNGVLNILFEDRPGKFVLTPQTPVRQLWISAQSTSFKLDWSPEQDVFVLAKTGESLKKLVERLLREFLDKPEITLA